MYFTHISMAFQTVLSKTVLKKGTTLHFLKKKKKRKGVNKKHFRRGKSPPKVLSVLITQSLTGQQILDLEHLCPILCSM